MRALPAGLAALALLSLSGAAIAQSHSSHDGHGGYGGPTVGVRPEGLSLTDQSGRSFTTANLNGRWTLVYFGYSRCRTACPIALPTISNAVEALRAHGREAQAVFIDIDAAPQPLRLRSPTQVEYAPHSDHAGGGTSVELARSFPSVTFLTGRRADVRNAVEAFRVRSEHVPPRTQLGEEGHSINHTTLIYVLDPGGVLAGYAYHDADPQALVAIVEGRAPSAH